MENITVERRKHKRRNIEAVIELKTLVNNDRYIISGRVKDIGLGGLKFESCHEFVPEDITVNFCDGSFLEGAEIKGRITRVVKEKLVYLYGVEFEELNFWEKVKIWYRTVW